MTKSPKGSMNVFIGTISGAAEAILGGEKSRLVAHPAVVSCNQDRRFHSAKSGLVDTRLLEME